MAVEKNIPVVTNCLVGSSLQLGCGFPTSQVQEMPETDIDKRFQIQSFYINRKVSRNLFWVYWKNPLKGEPVFVLSYTRYWKPFNFLGKRDAFFTDPSGLYGSFRRYGPTSCLTIVAETTEIVESAWVFNWGKGVGDVCFGGVGDLKTFCEKP